MKRGKGRKFSIDKTLQLKILQLFYEPQENYLKHCI